LQCTYLNTYDFVSLIFVEGKRLHDIFSLYNLLRGSMDRRRPLLIPPQKPSPIHRRYRSGDNRPFTSNSAPEKTANVRPATLGRSASRPLSISSTENNDEERRLDDPSDDHSDPAMKAPRTPTRPGLTSLLHSKIRERSAVWATTNNTCQHPPNISKGCDCSRRSSQS
jgi:hypothetical protein